VWWCVAANTGCAATSAAESESAPSAVRTLDAFIGDPPFLWKDARAGLKVKRWRAPGKPANRSVLGELGGTLGLLAGVGALAIPGLGPFIAAGPIMAALSGAAAGAAAGGLTGALVGLGIPEYEAKQYESKLKEGNLLISVHTDDRDERSRAKEAFKQNHAEDISTTGEARAS
jgi:outer membrane lipoprotein SlyB